MSEPKAPIVAPMASIVVTPGRVGLDDLAQVLDPKLAETRLDERGHLS